MDFKANDIGDLQLDALRALWNLGEGTVHEVLSAIPREPAPAYTTVLTVLRSLEKRGLVEHHLPVGERQYRYRPLLSMAGAERVVLEDLLARMFEGCPVRLLARLLEDERMTVRDLCDMRCVLEEALSAYAPAFQEAARVLALSDSTVRPVEEASVVEVEKTGVPPPAPPADTKTSPPILSETVEKKTGLREARNRIARSLR